MEIYLWQDGKEIGPFTKDAIFAKLRSKEISSDTKARRHEDSDWSTVNHLLHQRSQAFFSLQQIEEKQAELPSQVIIPDVSLASAPHKEEGSSGKRNPSLILPLLVLAIFLVLAFFVREFSLSPETADESTSPSVLKEISESKSPITAQNNPANATKSVPIKVVSSQKPAPAKPLPTPDAQPKAVIPAVAEPPTPVPLPQKSSVQVAENSSPKPIEQRSLSPAEPVQVHESTPVPSKLTTALAQTGTKPAPTPQTSISKTISTPTTTSAALLADFFKISSIKEIKKTPKDGIGVWAQPPPIDDVIQPPEFQPCLEVTVVTSENIRSDRLTAKAYFFDSKGSLLKALTTPSLSGTTPKGFEMPVLFYKNKPARLFFEIPESLRNAKWKAVVVFGDRYEAQSACYPITESDFLLQYPEKSLVYDRSRQRIERKPAMDPLVEHVVKTRNPRMPQITLFLRPPAGISDSKSIQGVMAICVLGGGIESVRRELQKQEMSGDYQGLFSFANTHKLAIIAWGSRSLWDPNLNWDELSKEKAKELNSSLDTVADAWERGVLELADKYGLPKNNFLLWGSCGSAQWAHRLCLRKPNYFLAINIHNSGSYDQPTPEASKVLWCVTTGELYAGYERSKRFVIQCKKLGYPIVYKAIEGLGHSGHPNASALGFEFFAFSLSQLAAKNDFETRKSDILTSSKTPNESIPPWLKPFQEPPSYGDMVNQEVFSKEDSSLIPEAFRIPLPTSKIQNIWNRKN